MAAIQVAGETEYDGEEGDRERFQRRMIERIITNFEDPDEAMGDENIEYLMPSWRRSIQDFRTRRTNTADILTAPAPAPTSPIQHPALADRIAPKSRAQIVDGAFHLFTAL